MSPPGRRHRLPAALWLPCLGLLRAWDQPEVGTVLGWMGPGHLAAALGTAGALAMGHSGAMGHRGVMGAQRPSVLAPQPWDFLLSPGACGEPRDAAGLISIGDLPLPVPGQR